VPPRANPDKQLQNCDIIQIHDYVVNLGAFVRVGGLPVGEARRLAGQTWEDAVKARVSKHSTVAARDSLSRGREGR
jgi:hypothetical protein